MSFCKPDPFEKRKTIFGLVALLIIALMLFSYIQHKQGDRMWSHNPYDSFTLQAQLWRNGKIKVIDKNAENYDELVQRYAYLELAIVDGDYYLSFPQSPALVMFLLTFIFEDGQTPSNFVSVVYSLITLSFAFLLCRRRGVSLSMSVVGALFVTFASSAFYIGLSGGVWFMAQSMAMALTMVSFYLMFCENKVGWHFAMFLLAIAVGARPFQIVYFLLFGFMLLKRYSYKIKKVLPYIISPGVVAVAMMIYNYIRFGSIAEFGHNFLPEFSRDEPGQYGQFSWNYIKDTAKAFLHSFPRLNESGGLQYSTQGFCFYISNMLFIVVILALLYKLNRQAYHRLEDENEYNIEIIILFILISIHVFSFFLHKTAGGHQFGARYMADVLPAALVFVLLCGKDFLDKFRVPITGICACCFALNFYGVWDMGVI